MPNRKTGETPPLTPAGQLQEARLASVLGYQLAMASLVTDAIFDQEVGEPLQLRRVEYTVLTLVAENPGSAPARLARALSVKPPSITVVVDRLVARRLVERSARSEDKRGQALGLTRQGANLVREATERLVKRETAALPLTAGERGILAELLHKLAGAR